MAAGQGLTDVLAMPSAPIWDQRPCHGMRDAYNDTVQPLPMCLPCIRWQQATPLIPAITPRAAVAGVVPVLVCSDRIPA